MRISNPKRKVKKYIGLTTLVTAAITFMQLLPVERACAQTFQQSEFVIGSFGDPLFLWEWDAPPLSPDQGHLDKLAFFRDAHFNLLSGHRMASSNRTDANIYYLQLLENLNATSTEKVKMLVSDWGWNTYDWIDGRGRILDTLPDTSLTNHSARFPYCLYCNGDGQPILDNYLGLSSSLKEGIFGFNLTDEPGPKEALPLEYQHLSNWNNLVKRNFPDLPVYINLFGRRTFDFDWGTPVNFDDYLESFLGTTGLNLEIASTDAYPVLWDADHDVYVWLDYSRYFSTMQSFRAKAGDKPFWCYVNSSYQHLNPGNPLDIAEPVESILRFGTSCPIAYGAKGLVYFMYEGYPQAAPDGQFQSYIIDANNPLTATQRYNEVKNINYYIKNVAAPVVMNAQYLGTFHKANAVTVESPPNEITADEDPIDLVTSSRNKIVADIDNDYLFFGSFKSNDAQLVWSVNYDDQHHAHDSTVTDTIVTYYLWLVNKDWQTASGSVQLDLKGWYWDQADIAPAEGNASLPYYNPGTMYTSLGISQTTGSSSGNFTPHITRVSVPSLEPGEGRMIRLKTRTSYGDPSYNHYNNSVCDNSVTVYPNPIHFNSAHTLNITGYSLNYPGLVEFVMYRASDMHQFKIFSQNLDAGDYSFQFDVSHDMDNNSVGPVPSVFYSILTTSFGCQVYSTISVEN